MVRDGSTTSIWHHGIRMRRARLTWDKVFSGATWWTAVAMGIIHIVYMFVPLWSFSRQCIMHVLLALTVVLLYKLAKATSSSQRVITGLLLLSTLVSVIYVAVEARRLEITFGAGITTLDFVIGCIIIGVVLVVTYLVWGKTIPIVGLIAILYLFFGHNIPGALGFPAVGTNVAMAYLSMGVSTGIFGFILPISASMVFYFMLFGGIMGTTGVLPMFLETGKWLGRGLRGGAAYTAIVGSSLIGTVTGATVANVAFTGQYTIPTMKDQGFSGPSAAAVESVASMGGQLLPPVMGAGAFVMAVITGIPYITICQKALLPALLYYIIVIVATALMIRSYNIAVARERVSKRLILERLPVFLVPLATLVYFLLILRYSPGLAIVIALFSCIAVSLILKSTRPSLRGLLDGLAKGARMGSEMAIALMTIAIVAQVAITTGLGPKLGHVMMSITGGIVPLSLLMMALLCLFLGLGMPTVAAYTLVAIIVVPGIVGLGIDLASAHLFAFYFAILAAVTPPVATAAVVSSKIAGSSFWQCALHGFKLSLPLFMVPFAFVNQPQLLDFPFIGVSGLIMAIAVLLFAWALSMSLYRHFLVRIDNVEMALCLLAAGISLAYIMLTMNSLFIAATVILLAVVSFRQIARRSQSAPE